MITKYRLLADAVNSKGLAKQGDVVCKCRFYDYGCASDDSRILGIPHISVTMAQDGGYPFFTVPERDLEPLDE